VCVCVSGLSYPACDVHAPCYIDICGLSDFAIFFSVLSHKWHDFSENKMCVLIFSTNFV